MKTSQYRIKWICQSTFLLFFLWRRNHYRCCISIMELKRNSQGRRLIFLYFKVNRYWKGFSLKWRGNLVISEKGLKRLKIDHFSAKVLWFEITLGEIRYRNSFIYLDFNAAFNYNWKLETHTYTCNCSNRWLNIWSLG